ncbi:MAG: inositol monophosphatase family protein [Planktomarina sp.]
MTPSANMNVMIAAARKAGRSLIKDFQEVENLQVSVKGAGDFVSRADHAAQAIIKEDLMEARPHYGWHAEEENEEIIGQDPTRRWIVDPLDGTTNFLHGLPHFAVSIALEHKGEIVAGVVYDPAKDELFFAEKGTGAFMNQSRLRVSGRRHMIECIFATGLPYAGNPHLADSMRDVTRLLPLTAGVRRWGSAALDLAYVAAGRYDGYWEYGLNAWDVAAGIIIVREAGGFVEPMKMGGDMLGGDGIICSSESMYPQLCKALGRDVEAF